MVSSLIAAYRFPKFFCHSAIPRVEHKFKKNWRAQERKSSREENFGEERTNERIEFFLRRRCHRQVVGQTEAAGVVVIHESFSEKMPVLDRSSTSFLKGRFQKAYTRPEDD